MSKNNYQQKRKNIKLLKANIKAAEKRLFGTDYVPGQEWCDLDKTWQ